MDFELSTTLRADLEAMARPPSRQADETPEYRRVAFALLQVLDRGMTQAEAARIAGVDRSTVSRALKALRKGKLPASRATFDNRELTRALADPNLAVEVFRAATGIDAKRDPVIVHAARNAQQQLGLGPEVSAYVRKERTRGDERALDKAVVDGSVYFNGTKPGQEPPPLEENGRGGLDRTSPVRGRPPAAPERVLAYTLEWLWPGTGRAPLRAEDYALLAACFGIPIGASDLPEGKHEQVRDHGAVRAWRVVVEEARKSVGAGADPADAGTAIQLLRPHSGAIQELLVAVVDADHPAPDWSAGSAPPLDASSGRESVGRAWDALRRRAVAFLLEFGSSEAEDGNGAQPNGNKRR